MKNGSGQYRNRVLISREGLDLATTKKSTGPFAQGHTILCDLCTAGFEKGFYIRKIADGPDLAPHLKQPREDEVGSASRATASSQGHCSRCNARGCSM